MIPDRLTPEQRARVDHVKANVATLLATTYTVDAGKGRCRFVFTRPDLTFRDDK